MPLMVTIQPWSFSHDWSIVIYCSVLKQTIWLQLSPPSRKMKKRPKAGFLPRTPTTNPEHSHALDRSAMVPRYWRFKNACSSFETVFNQSCKFRRLVFFVGRKPALKIWKSKNSRVRTFFYLKQKSKVRTLKEKIVQTGNPARRCRLYFSKFLSANQINSFMVY